MDKNRLEGAAEQVEWAMDHKTLVTEAKRRRCGGVASVFQRKFLGYSFWVAPGRVIRRRVADKPLATFKQGIRELTARSCGRSIQDVVQRLRVYLLGVYFGLAQRPSLLELCGYWAYRRKWPTGGGQ
ncbi:hypothetical protein [Paraburkholderia heleia]|uniref:hypothetical protein n=1 Tax=Paraburkholderia heleia TaxID=634127 RepID=UPI0031D09ADC